MATSTSKLAVVAALVLGLGSGALATVVVSERLASKQATALDARTSDVPKQGPIVSYEALPPPAYREAAPSAPAAPAAQAAAAPAPPPPSAPTETPEEARAAHVREHRAAIAEHERESIDPSWAPAATRSLSSKFVELSDRNQAFVVSSVDCRMVSCVATLRFDDFDHAEKTWRSLLEQDYEPNCAKEISLQEPSNRSAPYDVTMVMNCEEARVN